MVKFFAVNRQYAVVGASNNTEKFGFITTKWYIDRNLLVIPINPKPIPILGRVTESSVTSVMTQLATLNADGLSISFLTPPAVSLQTIHELARFPKTAELLKGLWFQPGSYDDTVTQAVEKYNMSHLMISLGECILVDGDGELYRSVL